MINVEARATYYSLSDGKRDNSSIDNSINNRNNTITGGHSK